MRGGKGILAEFEVCAVGEGHESTYPKNAKNAYINSLFQLVYRNFMGPFTPAAYGRYKYVSNITNKMSRWIVV